MDNSKQLIFNIIDLVLQENDILDNSKLKHLTDLGYTGKDVDFFYIDELNSIISLNLTKQKLLKEVTNIPFISKTRGRSIIKHIKKG